MQQFDGITADFLNDELLVGGGAPSRPRRAHEPRVLLRGELGVPPGQRGLPLGHVLPAAEGIAARREAVVEGAGGAFAQARRIAAPEAEAGGDVPPLARLLKLDHRVSAEMDGAAR